jgi:hypothetical protein
MRWSNEQFEQIEQELDPLKILQAQQSARGMFRVWKLDNTTENRAHPQLEEYESFLTEHGRSLAASWNRATDDGELDCKQGMPTTMYDPVPMEIVDDGDRILIRVLEYDIERVIYLNAAEGAEEPEPSPLGHSVGRWEGDTLVVDTTHVNWPQFDPYGTPQSNEAQYRESFRFNAGDETLEHVFTVTDPIIFTQPITFERARRWTPGVEIVPFNCVARWDGAGN